MDAAKALRAEGKKVAVVSMPSWDLFEAQPAEYRAEVLGTAPRIAIEAGARLGWDRWIGQRGAFIGMTGFGASAPAARPLPPLRDHRGRDCRGGERAHDLTERRRADRPDNHGVDPRTGGRRKTIVFTAEGRRPNRLR